MVRLIGVPRCSPAGAPTRTRCRTPPPRAHTSGRCAATWRAAAAKPGLQRRQVVLGAEGIGPGHPKNSRPPAELGWHGQPRERHQAATPQAGRVDGGQLPLARQRELPGRLQRQVAQRPAELGHYLQVAPIDRAPLRELTSLIASEIPARQVARRPPAAAQWVLPLTSRPPLLRSRAVNLLKRQQPKPVPSSRR